MLGFVCVFDSVKSSKKRRGNRQQRRERRSGTRESQRNKARESWATEQRCSEQLWHSQISPWLLSAGTWTLGLLGFGGKPRPHNPLSASSSCLTPPWPRAEDRKIRAMPSQRDSFILPAGMLPVTRAYIMGNIAGPRRNSPCPYSSSSSSFYFSLLINPPFSPSSPFPSSLCLSPLCLPLTLICSILFLPMRTLPPLLVVIYLFGPTRLGTFITDSLDTILKSSHQQQRYCAQELTHWNEHMCGRICIL